MAIQMGLAAVILDKRRLSADQPGQTVEERLAPADSGLAEAEALNPGVPQVQLYCPIAKSYRTKKGLMVYGWASVADYVDDQDEIVDPQGLREAVEEWKAWRNIRLMHQPDPIGVAPLVEIRSHPETGKDALWLGAHIVDERAISLIENGVLKGFSIGGHCVERVAETIDV